MAKLFKLSSNSVGANLKAHSGLGLFIVALLYLVCMTGVITIFYPEMERWEQADIHETTAVTPQQVQTALANIYADYQGGREQTGDALSHPEDFWVNLPNNDMPRFTVGVALPHEEGEELATQEFHVNADGTLGEKVEHEWTHFLTKLHYSLTIPGVWGITLVGAIGMVLVAMVISGILAHPNLFKNAFSLRIDRGERQQQVDLHNRIGVWATPFILAIALTGAMIALSQIFLFTFATGFYRGDTTVITNQLYMPHPEPTKIAAPLIDTAPILEKFQRDYPHFEAYYLSVHYPATTAQTVEIGAYLPDRLVWYDAFQYNAKGELIKRLGWPDGDAGMQIYASTYRLHFGHFGGLPVKIIYTLLGLGLCFICATGMNIWFRRQQQAGSPRAKTERMWLAVVWGFPCAIALTASTHFWWPNATLVVFWIASLALVFIALAARNRAQVSVGLRLLLVALIALTLVVHISRFGATSFTGGSLLFNGLLGLTALLLIIGLRCVVLNRVATVG